MTSDAWRMPIVAVISSLGLVSCGAREAVGPPPSVRGPEQRTATSAGLESASIMVGGHRLAVEVADDFASRARGLAGRETLADDEGMLFLYQAAESRSFWMKGCVIGLDIAFLDDERRIFRVGSLDPPGAAEIAAGRFPAFASEGRARYVLETRKGWFAARGLGVGLVVEFSDDIVQRARSLERR